MKKWKKTHRARKKNRLINFQVNFTLEQYERFNSFRIKNSWSEERAMKEVLKYIRKEIKYEDF